MFLNRILLDLRCREVRRDLADPYQLHSTLCRAFSMPDIKCAQGQFLWRLEPEKNSAGYPRILIQSRTIPNWVRIGVKGWLAKIDPPIDLKDRLGLDSLKVGDSFRFRLRANPCVTRLGKRLGLLKLEDQEKWIVRKGTQHGFSLSRLASFGFSGPPKGQIDVRVSQGQMLRGVRHSGNVIRVFSVLYDGILAVSNPNDFKDALRTGIGHGKIMGLGLLSVAPIS